MIPAVGLVGSIEMVRDGGSLAASFFGTDTCEYWLFLQIRRGEGALGLSKRIGYEPPVILDWITQRKIPITWQHARIFLSQIYPLIECERDHKGFEVISEAVELRGTLPPIIARRFQEDET